MWRLHIELFLVFMKIGTFTIGGGYAMLPMLQEEVVKKRRWVTEEEMLNYYAIGQSTPGIIAINTATFIGYKKKGVSGGITATLGMILPSLIIIMLIAALFRTISNNIYFQKAFSGIRVAVIVLIINAVIEMGKKAITRRYLSVLTISAFLLVTLFKISPVFIIIGAAILGIFISMLTGIDTERKSKC